MSRRKCGLKSCQFGAKQNLMQAETLGKQRSFSICKKKSRKQVKIHGVHLETGRQAASVLDPHCFVLGEAAINEIDCLA